MNIGDKVTWKVLNGTARGTIVGFCPQGIIVQTRPGYFVLADESSLNIITK